MAGTLMDIHVISDILKTLVFVTDVLIVAYVLWLLVRREVPPFIKRYGFHIAFVVALVSTVGSLYYSHILGYAPCLLCWFQRIFMYPLVIICGIAMVTKERQIAKYVVSLAVIGLIFAVWHYIIQRFPLASICDIGGSCARQYTFAFGYITIAMMAITGFVAIILLMWPKLRAK